MCAGGRWVSGVGVASGLIATIWWCAYQRPGLELPGMVKLLIASALVVLAAAEEAAAQDAAGSSNFEPLFISSDTKQVLFTTNVAVDGVDHVVEVRDGDNPVQVARDFAVMHKLDMNGLRSVLMHLKQKALVEGHMKRVFFQQPVVADKDGSKQVLNLTVYEDSEPVELSEKVGALYGLNEGQIKKLGGIIEREMVARMKLRTEVDMTENGVGMQTLVVRQDETAHSAVQRFAQYMAEVGITLSAEGIKVLANRVEDQMMKVAINRAAADAAEKAQ